MEYQEKLIEGNFPCNQVGAETKRERGASSSLPPLYFLHVWWARRPLTPSRAALLGSILPADTDPELFLQELGIVKKQAIIGDTRWTLVGRNLELVESDGDQEFISYSAQAQKALEKENERRSRMRSRLECLLKSDSRLAEDRVFQSWTEDNTAINLPAGVARIPVETSAASPADTNERIQFASSDFVKQTLGSEIRLDDEDRYGYGRAYETPISPITDGSITVLDPTAGGGSIPFEAMRLGCNVIANDLNPVATAIQYATLKYPAIYGESLLGELDRYGGELVERVRAKIGCYFESPPDSENDGYLFCRTVTCPSCGERAPLLNAFALQKKSDGWMVVPEIEGLPGYKKVRFIPVRLKNGKGPNGEDPERGTVKGGVGVCIHCGQAIPSDEIKRQACGESQYGTWNDDLYCVVAVRQQPKLDKNGNVMRYTSGPNKGQIRTEKVTFFREPMAEDYAALGRAKAALDEGWDHWDAMGLIPTEHFPDGNDMRPRMYGMSRWCDMFTPRQLLGHLTAMEILHDMMPEILRECGQEKGTAVITYLQYMIDKCIDYNSKQTRWHYSRGVLVGSFGRHDFSLKWSFGELIYTGPSSGLAWGKEQVLDSYRGICKLLGNRPNHRIQVLNGSAASMNVPDGSVDIICIDPPYYNNVQYAELSDYFYVWQKRTFGDLYPDVFNRRLTNKADEAVANPVRDGNAKEADHVYEQRMSEIFAECRRVMKDDGIMTVMFTHKTTEAWETLTRALIKSGWIISSAFPVDSEAAASIHQKDKAAVASSIFLACRKHDTSNQEKSFWKGFGGTGVLFQLRDAVQQGLKNYESLHLNVVDEMVAAYGIALKVLSSNWPVVSEDRFVSPTEAMKEASAAVVQYQMKRLTKGRLNASDLDSESQVALTLFGIYGLKYFPYDDALSLARSMNIQLKIVGKSHAYVSESGSIGINDERTGKRGKDAENEGYIAPLVKRGNKLRLARPEERYKGRLNHPQTEWDMLHGVIMAYQKDKIQVARAYLQRYAEGNEEKILDMLKVWAEGCGEEELHKEANRILFGLKDLK